MISYKTLVIITVMFGIVICNECEDCQECENCEEWEKHKKCENCLECEATLLLIGFDSEIGLYNYSFVNQFEDHEKFKNHILKYTISENIKDYEKFKNYILPYTKENGYLKAIYDVFQKEKNSIEEKYLYTPLTFCIHISLLTYLNTLQNKTDEFIEILKTSKDKRVVELTNNIGNIDVENCTTPILGYVYREADNRSTQYDDLNPYKNVLVSFDIAKKNHITISDNVLLRKLGEKFDFKQIPIIEILKKLEEVPEFKQIPIIEILKKLEEVPEFKQLPKYVFTYFSSHMYLAKATISAYERFKPSALCKNYLKENNTLKKGE